MPLELCPTCFKRRGTTCFPPGEIRCDCDDLRFEDPSLPFEEECPNCGRLVSPLQIAYELSDEVAAELKVAKGYTGCVYCHGEAQ